MERSEIRRDETNDRYEHEIKRENGDRIRINVDYSLYKNGFRVLSVGIIPKRKRSIQYIKCDDAYAYRCLDRAGREKYEMDKYLEAVTEDEMKEAVMTALEKMKPVINDREDLYKLM